MEKLTPSKDIKWPEQSQYHRCLKVLSDGKVIFSPANRYDPQLAACVWDMCGMAEKCKSKKEIKIRLRKSVTPIKDFYVRTGKLRLRKEVVK